MGSGVAGAWQSKASPRRERLTGAQRDCRLTAVWACKASLLHWPWGMWPRGGQCPTATATAMEQAGRAPTARLMEVVSGLHQARGVEETATSRGVGSLLAQRLAAPARPRPRCAALAGAPPQQAARPRPPRPGGSSAVAAGGPRYCFYLRLRRHRRRCDPRRICHRCCCRWYHCYSAPPRLSCRAPRDAHRHHRLNRHFEHRGTGKSWMLWRRRKRLTRDQLPPVGAQMGTQRLATAP